MKIFLLMIWIHFVSDFILQSDTMALNKSKELIWLSIHSVVYSLLFLAFGPVFGLVTMILHFIVDFFSSKLTSKLWQAGKRHWFFVVIGFDQAIHITTLILTYEVLHG